MEFKVVALDSHGKHQKLTEEFDSEESCLRAMENRSYHVVSIKKRSSKNEINFNLKDRGHQREQLYIELRELLNAGLTLQKAMAVMSDSQNTEVGKSQYQIILNGLREGKDFTELLFSTDLGKGMPVAEKLMLEAGQASGEFLSVIKQLSEFLKKQNNIKRQVLTLLMYPAILVFMMVGIFSYIYFVVLPQIFDTLVKLEIELPPATIWAMKALDWPIQNPLLFVAILIGLFFLVRQGWDVIKKEGEPFLLKIPIAGKAFRARLLFGLIKPIVLMMRRGIPLSHVLTSLKTENQSSPLIQELITQLHTQVREGGRIAPVIQASMLFKQSEKERIFIGEETGSVVDMLDSIDSQNDEAYENSLKNLVALIEPVIVVMIGAVILSFILLFFLPILQLDVGV